MKDSLVLYKQSPALVTAIGDKLEILLPGGKTRNVRDKDVFFLHPGPLKALNNLEEGAPEGQPEEAWELLQGMSPTLQELAELVYGEHTPATAWLAFKLLNRTPWFRGKPEEIEVVDPAVAAERVKAENDKAEAERQWEDFITRFAERKIDPDGDELYLRDLEMFALGVSKGSRILKVLGKTQTPENAHRTMLAYGVKPESWNPHPLRLDVPLDIPDYPLGEVDTVPCKDLTQFEAFAIDDEGNQDPDDAVSWDGKRLWVHVADAASLFPVGSAQDEAARQRAGSLYLPETTVPMIPKEAVERLGLGLQGSSPALSYVFEVQMNDAACEIVDFDIQLTRVRVSRLSYDEANQRMSEEPFASIKRITDAFRKQREEAGSVTISLPEVKIRVLDDGNVDISPLPELESRMMVSEAMLMAGNYAAKWCLERNIAVPYASQEIAGIDNPTDQSTGESPSIATSTVNPVAELASTDTVSNHVSAAQAADFVRQFELRKGMKRSRTSLEPARHDGLGLDIYLRVTSPLRRYPDLIASQQIRATLLGREAEPADAVLEALAVYQTQSGSLVQAERRSNMMWKLLWLKQRPGWTGEAVMVDRRDRQGYFLIPEIALEHRVALKKTIPLGSRVRLKLKEVDIPESSVVFVIEEVIDEVFE